MRALTRNDPLTWRGEGASGPMEVAAGARIFHGAALERNRHGRVLPLCGASKSFVGFASQGVDNTLGMGGERLCPVQFSGTVAEVHVEGSELAAVGARVYMPNDGTFTTKAEGGTLVGSLERLIDPRRSRWDVRFPYRAND